MFLSCSAAASRLMLPRTVATRGFASPPAPTGGGGMSFRVLGVQHIAIGGLTREPLRRLWCDLLGVKRVGEYESERENVREDILRVGKGEHAVEIDIMEPMNPEIPPRVHSPPLNHVGLWVDDIRACYEELQAAGVRFTPGGIRKGAAGHQVVFIHPKGQAGSGSPLGGEGVLIELVQAPKNVIEVLSHDKDDE